jgi:uncharacterized membrane protein
MNSSTKTLLAVQAFAILSIILNLPILRQVLGYIYLIFVPGYVILRALRFRLNTLDQVLFSVGLSISLSMIIGLLMSGFFPLFGLFKPLSFAPLLVVFTTLVVILSLVGDSKEETIPELSMGVGSQKQTAVMIGFLFLLPILSVVGILSGNIPMLVAMILLVALVFGLGFRTRLISEKYAPLVIFSVSFALIFSSLLISKHIVGEDIYYETFVFKNTLADGLWKSPGLGVNGIVPRFSSVLSITVLPTIYSIFTDTGADLIYKIIYPLFFCLVPIVLYRIYQIQTNKVIALVSTFYFMSTTALFGLEALTIARQIVAELLLVLLVLALVEKNIPERLRLFLIFSLSVGLIVSHYALAYYFLVLVFVCYLVLPKSRPKNDVTLAVLLMLFTMTFAWYVYVSDAPLLKISTDLARIRNNFLTDFSNPAARSQQISTLASAAPSLVSVVHRLIFYLQNFLIVLGVVELVLKRKELGLRRNIENIEAQFGSRLPKMNRTLFKFDANYSVISLVALLVLILCLVIPSAAGTFNFTRFYDITIIYLAPFFVIGGLSALNLVGRICKLFVKKIFARNLSHSFGKLSLQIISVLLVASFLFSSGLIEHVTGVYPESWALDQNLKKNSADGGIRFFYYSEVPQDQDISGAIWLSKNMNYSYPIYSGQINGAIIAYTTISPYQLDALYRFSSRGNGSYAFVGCVNTAGKLIFGDSRLINSSELSFVLSGSNEIYSNGDTFLYSSVG